jgi:hypothetical protein
VGEDDEYCGDIDDCSVRAFAVKAAPSARRHAALGLTARRGRANPATVPLMHSTPVGQRPTGRVLVFSLDLPRFVDTRSAVILLAPIFAITRRFKGGFFARIPWRRLSGITSRTGSSHSTPGRRRRNRPINEC